MKIFVGLGNPGREYASTKHNVGFMLADRLARELSAPDWHESFRALIAAAYVGGEKILLVKPQTFMNLSGEAVRPILDYYKVETEELIVAHDDMDIPLGTIRLRAKGSSGGHRGAQSIIDHLGGATNFARVRIGVGRPPEHWSVNGHVLSPFSEEDRKLIDEAIERLVPAVQSIVTDGIEYAMNKYNPKKKKAVAPSTIEAEEKI